MFGPVRYDEGKENVFYMIAINPEQTLSIEFSFHDEKMAEFAILEQMGEHGEICKITMKKPTDKLWLHCGRTFLDGSFDNSGQNIRIVKRPEKTVLKKLAVSKKAVTASWKEQSADGYQIRIAANKSFTRGVKTYTVAGVTKKTFKKLAGGKIYYVKVRAYRYAGGEYYGKWSNAKSIICK